MPTAKTPPVTRHLFPPTVETVNAELERLVAERRALQAAGAEDAALDDNRARLTAAQARLSELLVGRHAQHGRTA